jgi:hypothetical protein
MATESNPLHYRNVILSDADMVNLDEPEVFEETLRSF